MKAKRRGHDPEFKARVALEAIKGIETIQKIAKEFEKEREKTVCTPERGAILGGL